MAMEFTSDQKQVIYTRGSNILVSAGAGSGKTAVLTECILQKVLGKKAVDASGKEYYIDKPVDIDRMLVVTFTNAAAAEMRERIGKKLTEALNADPSDTHLQKQVALLHNAQITTIDSFCLFVLRNNFQVINLDPSFRVADDGEIKLVRKDVLDALLEECYGKNEQSFTDLVEYICVDGKESVLEDLVIKLYDRAMSNPFPELWLNARRKDYGFRTVEEMLNTDWATGLYNHLKQMCESYAVILKEALEICDEADGPLAYREAVSDDIEQVAGLQETVGLKSLKTAMEAISWKKLSSKKSDGEDPAKRDAVKAMRELVKKGVKDALDSYFAVPFEWEVACAPACYAAENSLIDLCLLFMQRFEEAKRKQNLLDFSDMEHLALRILVHPIEGEEDNIGYEATDAALEYRSYFDEILVDEYQDSNLVQEILLGVLSGEKEGRFNRFMVGDVKQSIYRFRLARPEIFREKYDCYRVCPGKEDGSAANDGVPNVRIDLHQNFRSRDEVIDTVNEIFRGVMKKEFGGIEYDEAAELVRGANYPENTGCETELHLFEEIKADPEAGIETAIDKRTAEQIGVADVILRLKRDHFKVTDKETGELREMKWKDIVILLRSVSGIDEEFKEALASRGIPAYVEGKSGYLSAKEITDVLGVLRVLDNPLNDVPLFGMMKSIFGGFGDEEAAAIRCRDESRKLSLYEEVRKYALEGKDDSLAEKCRGLLATIDKYRKYCAYMTVPELLQTLFDEFRYPVYVSALPAGSQRLANVEMMLTKAEAFEKDRYHGLFHFIRYIEEMEKYEMDYGEAATLDENADVVRIMSIHKSKGLEFPVAIVSALDKSFNKMDLYGMTVFDADYGMGMKYVDFEKRVSAKTLRRNALELKACNDMLAEELRVLYVALTRAKEKLIMTAGSKDISGEMDKLGKGAMTYGELANAKCLLDFVLPVFNGEARRQSDPTETEIKETLSTVEREQRLEIAGSLADGEGLSLLRKHFAYRYPHEELEGLYTKVSVSELKHAAMLEAEEGVMAVYDDDALLPPEPKADSEIAEATRAAAEEFDRMAKEAYVPEFARTEAKVLGTTVGSAMHRVMELLDFRREYTSATEVLQEMERFRAEGRLSDEYHDAAVNRVEKILKCLQHPIVSRMCKAAASSKLYKEQPFVMGVTADRLPPRIDANGNKIPFPGTETVLVQGIIDAFFEENGENVLLDYKTDRVSAEELVSRYKKQIDIYQEAIEKITGKQVKERALYSFYLGCTVNL